MKGAIPYYRIQKQLENTEAKAVVSIETDPAYTHELLCGIAHRVNNLLMRMQGWTSLMLLDIKRGRAGFDNLKQIENYIDYGAVLTSQLLAFAGRGVYADPVNIPPLLLEPQGDAVAAPGEYDIRSKLLIVVNGAGQLRPGLLEACRNITERIAALFTGIEQVTVSGRNRKLAKQYALKIRRVTDEGLKITRSAAAGFRPQRSRFVQRYPERQRLKAKVIPAYAGGRF